MRERKHVIDEQRDKNQPLSPFSNKVCLGIFLVACSGAEYTSWKTSFFFFNFTNHRRLGCEVRYLDRIWNDDNAEEMEKRVYGLRCRHSRCNISVSMSYFILCTCTFSSLLEKEKKPFTQSACSPHHNYKTLVFTEWYREEVWWMSDMCVMEGVWKNLRWNWSSIFSSCNILM